MHLLSLRKIIEEHKTEYHVALRTAQKDGKSPKARVARWIHFFIDAMVPQIEVLSGFLESTSSPDTLLSPNPKEALALFDKNAEISTKLVADKLGVPSVTTKQILNRLLEFKLIRRKFHQGQELDSINMPDIRQQSKPKRHQVNICLAAVEGSI